jgi:hypothetical protein
MADPLQLPLRDIHGIDAVPWWPPAPGWWLLAIGGLLLVALRGRWRLWWMPAWRRAAIIELRPLRRVSQQLSPRERIAAFSALLRRIAMARHGRAVCAGLQGSAWLDWLSAQDPVGFDWRCHGQILLHAPYAPPALSETDRTQLEAELQRLINAAEAWVSA